LAESSGDEVVGEAWVAALRGYADLTCLEHGAAAETTPVTSTIATPRRAGSASSSPQARGRGARPRAYFIHAHPDRSDAKPAGLLRRRAPAPTVGRATARPGGPKARQAHRRHARPRANLGQATYQGCAGRRRARVRVGGRRPLGRPQRAATSPLASKEGGARSMGH
jgi:hypothetical protein